MLHLGVTIEPHDPDASAADSQLLPADLSRADLVIGQEAPGAAVIASTKELQSVLDDLGAKIGSLESSLNQDLEALQTENERLRALIRNMQRRRQDFAAPQVGPENPPAAGATLSAQSPPAKVSFRQVLQAYQQGDDDLVTLLAPHVKPGQLTPAQTRSLHYWLADARFRLGRFNEARQALEPVLTGQHPLRDDAIVLHGLILLQLGQDHAALAQFLTIVDQFPDSDYLRLAKMAAAQLTAL